MRIVDLYLIFKSSFKFVISLIAPAFTTIGATAAFFTVMIPSIIIAAIYTTLRIVTNLALKVIDAFSAIVSFFKKRPQPTTTSPTTDSERGSSHDIAPELIFSKTVTFCYTHIQKIFPQKIQSSLRHPNSLLSSLAYLNVPLSDILKVVRQALNTNHSLVLKNELDDLLQQVKSLHEVEPTIFSEILASYTSIAQIDDGALPRDPRIDGRLIQTQKTLESGINEKINNFNSVRTNSEEKFLVAYQTLIVDKEGGQTNILKQRDPGTHQDMHSNWLSTQDLLNNTALISQWSKLGLHARCDVNNNNNVLILTNTSNTSLNLHVNFQQQPEVTQRRSQNKKHITQNPVTLNPNECVRVYIKKKVSSLDFHNLQQGLLKALDNIIKKHQSPQGRKYLEQTLATIMRRKLIIPFLTAHNIVREHASINLQEFEKNFNYLVEGQGTLDYAAQIIQNFNLANFRDEGTDSFLNFNQAKVAYSFGVGTGKSTLLSILFKSLKKENIKSIASDIRRKKNHLPKIGRVIRQLLMMHGVENILSDSASIQDKKKDIDNNVQTLLSFICFMAENEDRLENSSRALVNIFRILADNSQHNQAHIQLAMLQMPKIFKALYEFAYDSDTPVIVDGDEVNDGDRKYLAINNVLQQLIYVVCQHIPRNGHHISKEDIKDFLPKIENKDEINNINCIIRNLALLVDMNFESTLEASSLSFDKNSLQQAFQLENVEKVKEHLIKGAIAIKPEKSWETSLPSSTQSQKTAYQHLKAYEDFRRIFEKTSLKGTICNKLVFLQDGDQVQNCGYKVSFFNQSQSIVLSYHNIELRFEASDLKNQSWDFTLGLFLSASRKGLTSITDFIIENFDDRFKLHALISAIKNKEQSAIETLIGKNSLDITRDEIGWMIHNKSSAINFLKDKIKGGNKFIQTIDLKRILIESRALKNIFSLIFQERAYQTSQEIVEDVQKNDELSERLATSLESFLTSKILCENPDDKAFEALFEFLYSGYYKKLLQLLVNNIDQQNIIPFTQHIETLNKPKEGKGAPPAKKRAWMIDLSTRIASIPLLRTLACSALPNTQHKVLTFTTAPLHNTGRNKQTLCQKNPNLKNN